VEKPHQVGFSRVFHTLSTIAGVFLFTSETMRSVSYLANLTELIFLIQYNDLKGISMTNIDSRFYEAEYSIIDHIFISRIVNNCQSITQEKLQHLLRHVPIVSEQISRGHIAMKMCCEEPKQPSKEINTPNYFDGYCVVPTCGTKL
jgi:hypothetical protein